MKILSLKITRTIVLVTAIVGVAYAALYFSEAEAVYSRTVGTISINNFIPNSGSSYESITLSFSGVIGQESIADLSDWSIQNSDSTFIYDLSNVYLVSTTSVKLCEETAADPNCNYRWNGTDVFADDGDTLRIIARDGTTVIDLTYTSSNAGVSFSDSGNYITEVYTARDKILICDTHKNGTLRIRNSSLKKLINNQVDDTADNTKIIPSFVYENNKILGYHSGVNWPAGSKTLAANCR
jgi:hypothetical protein